MSKQALTKRTKQELRSMPKPRTPADLEVLSQWYFGKKLHLATLRVYESGHGNAASAQYQVAELYNDYHGKGWLHSERCINGYDYSCDFWEYVIGPLYCGGIGGHSYGQVRVFQHRDAKRLAKFSEYLRRNESGRLGKAFERLALKHGEGENTATRDSGVLTTGRADGAGAVSISQVSA